MNYILFDDTLIRSSLLPFTFTRPVSEIRLGIVTITEKWQSLLKSPVSFLTETYLQAKYPQAEANNRIYINGAVCPDEALIQAVEKLKINERLTQEETLIAFKTDTFITEPALLQKEAGKVKEIVYSQPSTVIRKPYDIFIQNGAQILADFERITRGRESYPITDPHTKVYNPESIFLEEGVTTMAAVLNAQTGPIYIGKNAIIQEGCLVRGNFAIGEGSILHMGSKMRGDNTIGPHCKVGGEITNSVFFGYSNKAHEGYLGNSIIGEWCNLGADTNTSNMKNDYGNIKLWSYAENKLVDTGRQFCGLMMGDHSKAGINTMFNTGTVTGVSANIFGGDYPPKFIPSFTWGGAKGLEVFQLEKALEVARNAMQRRGKNLDETEKKILEHVFAITHQQPRKIGFTQ